MNADDDAPPDRTMAYDGGAAGEGELGRSGPRYALGNLHAAGGIGEVWLARDRDLDREVAVKRLRSRIPPTEMTKARFLREARITGQLDHPGVVPVYEICLDETTGLPFYAMRFLRGRTLTAAVRDRHAESREPGPQSQALLDLLNAFVVVCNTIAYAHSKGIVHRDLKCDNVILGDFGEAVVIDWGLAKRYGQADDEPAAEVDPDAFRPAETVAGHILGTPAYMAPEQAAGDHDAIGPRTDVYGLCAILYEILCGRPPFTGTGTIEVLKAVRQSPPVRPGEVVPGVPDALERICLKGLAKRPEERHESAERLAREVRSWVGELAEKRQAEEERERFFALSRDLLAIVDADGLLRQVGPAWTTLLDRDRDAVLGRPFPDFIHDDDRAEVRRTLAAACADGAAATFEARALHRDGSTRWVSWNVTSLARERSLYLVGRDITELKRARQLFEGILQSAPDALILIDPAGRIVLANRQAEHLFGHSREEMLGQPIELLVPHRFRERHPAHVAGFFATSSFRPMGSGLALRGLRKDGSEFPAEVSLSAIPLETTKWVAASIRDLSTRESPRPATE